MPSLKIVSTVILRVDKKNGPLRPLEVMGEWRTASGE
jgi:hypothetical protein